MIRRVALGNAGLRFDTSRIREKAIPSHHIQRAFAPIILGYAEKGLLKRVLEVVCAVFCVAEGLTSPEMCSNGRQTRSIRPLSSTRDSPDAKHISLVFTRIDYFFTGSRSIGSRERHIQITWIQISSGRGRALRGRAALCSPFLSSHPFQLSNHCTWIQTTFRSYSSIDSRDGSRWFGC